MWCCMSAGQCHDSVPIAQRAEDFLRTAARLERFAGGGFDFISVCPPYELVDYIELYDLLDASPLVRCAALHSAESLDKSAS